MCVKITLLELHPVIPAEKYISMYFKSLLYMFKSEFSCYSFIQAKHVSSAEFSCILD